MLLFGLALTLARALRRQRVVAVGLAVAARRRHPRVERRPVRSRPPPAASRSAATRRASSGSRSPGSTTYAHRQADALPRPGRSRPDAGVAARVLEPLDHDGHRASTGRSAAPGRPARRTSRPAASSTGRSTRARRARSTPTPSRTGRASTSPARRSRSTTTDVGTQQTDWRLVRLTSPNRLRVGVQRHLLRRLDDRRRQLVLPLPERGPGLAADPALTQQLARDARCTCRSARSRPCTTSPCSGTSAKTVRANVGSTQARRCCWIRTPASALRRACRRRRTSSSRASSTRRGRPTRGSSARRSTTRSSRRVRARDAAHN